MTEASTAASWRLECFALSPTPPRLVPADPLRGWMEDFPGRHAYRCLPMAVANSYGWEILSPCRFAIDWTGAMEADAIAFRALDGFPYLGHFASTNFTRGVVTFHTGYMFRTPPEAGIKAPPSHSSKLRLAAPLDRRK